MASNAETFILKLQEQISGPAGAATSAMAQLEAKINAEKTALAGLEAKAATSAAKLQTLGQGVNGSVNIAAFKKEQQALASLQAQADKTAQGIRALEGAKGTAAKVDALGSSGEQATLSMRALAGGLNKLGGPMGEAGSKAAGFIGGLQKINKSLGAAGPYGAIAVAVIAIAAAFVIATVAIAKFAIGLADTNRSAALATAGLAASSKALGNLANILPDIQAQTGLATADIQKMAESLAAAGVSAKNMPAALKALATATAGGATAEFIAKLEAGLKATGKVPPELAKQMTALEAIAKKKMLSLSSQSETLQRNLAGVFGGLNIEGLLGGLAKLVGLFDKNTASGKAMKFLFETLFQPIIDGAAAALPYVERFFIVALTWAVRAYTALKPYAPAILFVAKVFAVLAAVVAGVVVGSLALVVGFFAAAVAVIGLVVAAVVALVGVIWGGLVAAWGAISGAASSAWDAVKGAVQGALDWLSGLSLADIGSNIISSLASGILGAAGAVLSAITGAVGGALNAAKSMLGISSPSKVFAQIGMHTSAGMAEGIDAGAGDVQSSMKSMVAPPDAVTGGAKGGGPSLTFTGCTFGGDLTEDRLRAWILGFIQGEGLQADPVT